MSRQIDFNKPDEWTDEDVEYLRQRPETVPVHLRDRLNVQAPLAPSNAAESVEIDRLRQFLLANFEDEMNEAMTIGDTPVGVAIRLLSDEFETVDPNESSDAIAEEDTYDNWKVSELKAEVDNRNTDPNRTAPEITPASDKKADLVAALRADDAAS